MKAVAAVRVLWPIIVVSLICGGARGSEPRAAFATFEGTEVSDQKLAELLHAAHGGTVLFTQLKVLTDAQAERLGRFDGLNIYLVGLDELSPQQARLLARFQGGHLTLDGLRELEPEVARELRACRCGALTLNGLDNVSLESLDALKGLAIVHLMLLGLDSIRTDQARILAQIPVQALHLGVTNLSVEAARHLADARSFRLELANLTNPSVAVLRELSHLHERDKFMHWLDSIEVASPGWPPPSGRQILLRHRQLHRLFPIRSLQLGGVVALTPEQAAALAPYRGDQLLMPKLDSVSMELLRATREERELSAPVGANGIPAHAPIR